MNELILNSKFNQFFTYLYYAELLLIILIGLFFISFIYTNDYALDVLPSMNEGIPTTVSNVLLTRFDGFVLLTT